MTEQGRQRDVEANPIPQENWLPEENLAGRVRGGIDPSRLQHRSTAMKYYIENRGHLSTDEARRSVLGARRSFNKWLRHVFTKLSQKLS